MDNLLPDGTGQKGVKQIRNYEGDIYIYIYSERKIKKCDHCKCKWK